MGSEIQPEVQATAKTSDSKKAAPKASLFASLIDLVYFSMK